MLRNKKLTKKSYTMAFTRKTIIILALLVGLIYVFPHFIYQATSEHYNLLSIDANLAALDESAYAAGVQEALEGKLIPTDLAVFEHKNLDNSQNSPFFYDPLPFIIMAVLAKAAGGIKSAIIVSDFLFSALAFLLFYFLSNRFLKNKMLSVVSALVFIFFYRLFIPPGDLSLAGIWNHFAAILFNPYGEPANFWLSRFVQPQVPILFFLGCIGALYVALQKDHWKLYLLAGIVFALNFYSYFYFWTFLLVLFGLIFLYFFLKKEKKKAMGVLMAIAVGLFLAIPYFINLINAQQLDLSLRSGIEYGRFVETISVFYLLLFLLFCLVLHKKKKEELPFHFLGSLLLTGAIVLNAQLITGFTVQNNHWNSRAIVPVLILFVFYCMKELYVWLDAKHNFPIIQKLPRLFPLFIVLSFLLAAIVQAQEVRALGSKYSFSQSEHELLNWLEANAPPESVVLTANLTWNYWIPAYTKSNVYFPYAVATLASDEEMKERFIHTFKLLNKTDEEVELQLSANSAYARYTDKGKAIDYSMESFLKSHIFVDAIYPIEHSGIFGMRKQYRYDAAPVNELIAQYKATKVSLADVQKYRVDYVLLVEEERELAPYFVKMYGMKLAFSSGDFVLLKIG